MKGYQFAGQTYQDIPALLTVLITTNDKKIKVSHLKDKATKIALLDELARLPLHYFNLLGHDHLYDAANAFFRLLRLQRKLGRSSSDTSSMREVMPYALLMTAKGVHALCYNMEAFSAKFNAEAPLPLDRRITGFQYGEKTPKPSTLPVEMKDMMYAERALRYMQARSYARAAFDLELAKFHLLRSQTSWDQKTQGLMDIHALCQASYFKMGCCYEEAIKASIVLAEENYLNTLIKKFYASVGALLCASSERAKHYNPIQLLAGVLLDPEFQTIAFERERAFLLESIDNPVFEERLATYNDPNNPGLLIALKNLLPRKDNVAPEAPAPVAQPGFPELFQNTLLGAALYLKATSLACLAIYAEKQAAQEDVSVYADEINSAVTFLLTQPITKEELIRCFFCVDPIMPVYPALCEAIQARFEQRDPAFNAAFEACLQNAANPQLTNAQKAAWYWTAIRLCAADSKQELLKLLNLNPDVMKMFKGEPVFPDVPAIPRETMELYFNAPKTQEMVQEKHAASVALAGMFAHASVGGSLPTSAPRAPKPQ